MSAQQKPILQYTTESQHSDTNVTEQLDDNIILTFGKYKGKSFQSAAKDWKYCEWIIKQKFSFGQFERLKKYIEGNRKAIADRNYERAKTEEGSISKRVRTWDLETMRNKGVIISPLVLNNHFIGTTRRPRAASYDLQTCSAVPKWDEKMTEVEKEKIKVTTTLCSRFISYVFRRMVHHERGNEKITEPLVADHAIMVLRRNYNAYVLAKKHASPKNDPDGKVNIFELEKALQDEISTCVDATHLPDSLTDCFSRLGLCKKAISTMIEYHSEWKKNKNIPPYDPEMYRFTGPIETHPRAILTRFLMTEGDVSRAVTIYRDLEKRVWNDVETLRACWVMAQADGAIETDRIINIFIPPVFLNYETVPIFAHALRMAKRHMSLYIVPAGKLMYAPCLGFGTTGCLMDIDYCTESTVYGIRSGLWVNSAHDVTYLQCYAGLARYHGRKITTICIIYLQHGCTHEVDISEWDHVPLLSFLNSSDTVVTNACDRGMCELPREPEMKKFDDVDQLFNTM